MGYYGLPPAKYSDGPLEPTEKALRGLPPPKCMQALDLIETTTRKVAQNPNDPKFRKLRLSNEKISAGITDVEGAFEIMNAFGWIIECEGEDAFLILPEDVKLTFPDHVHKILEAKAWYVKENETRRRALGLSRIPREGEEFLPREDANRTAPAITPLREAVKKAHAVPVQRSSGTKKPQSAFNFESRAKKEEEITKAQEGLAGLRAAQKEKFSQFKDDPQGYEKQQALVSQNSNDPKDDTTWYNPMSWFGGGGGSGGDGGGRPGGSDGSNQRRNIKSMSDLPKPPQGG